MLGSGSYVEIDGGHNLLCKQDLKEWELDMMLCGLT